MTHSFDRDDIPLPTPVDTILEVLALGPHADTEIFNQSEKMGRGHSLKLLKVARAHLVTRGTIIVAAGHALVPPGNGRCACRYMLA